MIVNQIKGSQSKQNSRLYKRKHFNNIPTISMLFLNFQVNCQFQNQFTPEIYSPLNNLFRKTFRSQKSKLSTTVKIKTIKFKNHVAKIKIRKQMNK